MPTNRTRRTRAPRQDMITPEAVEAYRTAKKHADRYHDCIGLRDCHSPHPGRHCAECRAHIAASYDLHVLLDIKPWEQNPVFLDDEPPEPRAGQPWLVPSWHKVKALRDQLEAAIKEQGN